MVKHPKRKSRGRVRRRTGTQYPAMPKPPVPEPVTETEKVEVTLHSLNPLAGLALVFGILLAIALLPPMIDWLCKRIG